jgi:hypothetical protein
MPQFMRFLCSDQRMQLGESGFWAAYVSDVSPKNEWKGMSNQTVSLFVYLSSFKLKI